MMEMAFAAFALIAVTVLWFAWGVLRAIRDVLAERAAGWMLPSQQPITFRLAQFLAFLAQALAPRHKPVMDLAPGAWRHSWYLIFPVQWRGFYWPESELMLGELESDLLAERQVLDPVRLVAPLLIAALKLRLIYLRRIMIYITWIPVGLVLYLLLMSIVTFGLDTGFEYVVGRGRRLARRMRFGARR
jgi:hypothetical protein